MVEDGARILAVLALVLANGFFVAAEFALVTVRRTRIEQLVAEKRPGARNVQDAITHIDSYIAACQLGITIASLALGWVGEAVVAHLLEPTLGQIAGHAVSVAFAFVIITALHVVAGELAPKGIALQYPERAAFVVAAPLRIFRLVFRPAIWLLNEGGWAAARLVGVSRSTSTHESGIAADELRLVIQASAQAGTIREEEQLLMERVFRFYSRHASEVMVPRTEAVWLESGMTVRDFYEQYDETPHSRFPVFRETADNVVGIVNIKDVLRLIAQGKVSDDSPVDAIMRPAHFVPETKLLGELFLEMQSQRQQMAIIVDEYGGTAGIVTIEVLLEEMVGRLTDELGQPIEEFKAIDERTVRIEGGMSVDEAREELKLDIPEGDYETVAGYVLDVLGHIPVAGETFIGDGFSVRVIDVQGRKIEEVIFTRFPRREEDAEEETPAAQAQ
jgi:CBS domain containing-hemolysin-like protein